MELKQINNVKFYVFKIFEEFENQGILKHAFSTKIGGVSTGIYESMNLYFREDKKENVLENYKIFCNAIDCNYRNIVFSNQIHKDNIYKATKKDRGKGLIFESNIKGYDALITNDKDVILTTFYADCLPIYLFDYENKAIGLAHSGWRGTVKEIGKKTAIRMKKEFNTDFSKLKIGIGPSICSCCFEVDSLVVNEFTYNIEYSLPYIWDFNGKYKIDLQSIVKKSFIDIGVNKENIEVSNICTKCNSDIFFSHRKNGEKRGSLAALMCLK